MKKFSKTENKRIENQQIYIGITVDSSESPMSAPNLKQIIGDTEYIFDKKAEVNFFEPGVDYIRNGCANNEHATIISQLVNLYFLYYDGLVIPGNSNNINPAFYDNNSQQIDLNESQNRRTQLEISLVLGALARGVPILGVCNGNQIINVALGGKLKNFQELTETSIHSPAEICNDASTHNVIYEKDTLLYSSIIKPSFSQKNMDENGNIICQEWSSHTQAIDKSHLPSSLKITATNSNNIVKGIEMHGHHPWVIGTQYHPEVDISKHNRLFFKTFLEICYAVKIQKSNLLDVHKSLISSNKISKIELLPEKLSNESAKRWLKTTLMQTEEQERSTIAEKYQEIISGNDIGWVIPLLPKESRLSFTQLCQNKIEHTRHIQEILLSLPEKNKWQFIKEYINLFKVENIDALHFQPLIKPDDSPFISVLRQLPEENRLLFAQKCNSPIQYEADLINILPLIPVSDQLDFLKCNKRLLNDTFDLVRVLQRANRIRNYTAEDVKNIIYPWWNDWQNKTATNLLGMLSLVQKKDRLSFIKQNITLLTQLKENDKNCYYGIRNLLDDAECDKYKELYKEANSPSTLTVSKTTKCTFFSKKADNKNPEVDNNENLKQLEPGTNSNKL